MPAAEIAAAPTSAPGTSRPPAAAPRAAQVTTAASGAHGAVGAARDDASPGATDDGRPRRARRGEGVAGAFMARVLGEHRPRPTLGAVEVTLKEREIRARAASASCATFGSAAPAREGGLGVAPAFGLDVGQAELARRAARRDKAKRLPGVLHRARAVAERASRYGRVQVEGEVLRVSEAAVLEGVGRVPHAARREQRAAEHLKADGVLRVAAHGEPRLGSGLERAPHGEQDLGERAVAAGRSGARATASQMHAIAASWSPRWAWT